MCDLYDLFDFYDFYDFSRWHMNCNFLSRTKTLNFFMPELPDLEIFSGNLQKKLHGKKLIRISVKKNPDMSLSKLKKAIEGEKIKKIYREGKELRFEFDN